MRSIILIGAVIIAQAINPTAFVDVPTQIFGTVLVILLVMDLVEFIHNLRK